MEKNLFLRVILVDVGVLFRGKYFLEIITYETNTVVITRPPVLGQRVIAYRCMICVVFTSSMASLLTSPSPTIALKLV